MPNELQIKYKYALNSAQQIIDVSLVARSTKTQHEIYHCISCDQLLIPVLGNKRQKHFRHEVEANCNPETYLHRLAKQLFFQQYNNCLQSGDPFTLVLFEKCICVQCKGEFGITCDLEPERRFFNLPKLFPNISVEVPDGNFIPDILLTNGKGEKLYIEFAVFHQSTEEKIASGRRIIEFSITTEDDLEPIRNLCISSDSRQIKLINFRELSKVASLTPGMCKRNHSIFILKKDGTAYIFNGSIFRFQAVVTKAEVVFSKILSGNSSMEYLDELEKVYFAKKYVRNCFLCRYHGKNLDREEGEGPIYCKFIKRKFKSTQAVKCSYYLPDPKVFPSQTQ